MKVIPVADAVGMVLCHDMSGITPDVDMEHTFCRGHVVTEKDVPILLRTGAEHLFVLDMPPGHIHRDKAAMRIAKAAAGPGLTLAALSEGRVNMRADPGLLAINVEALYEINSIEGIALATMHDGMPIAAPRGVAGTCIAPLIVDEAKVEQAEAICEAYSPIIQIRPLQPRSVAIITSDNDLFHAQSREQSGPALSRKIEILGSRTVGQAAVSSDAAATRDAILKFVVEGADMVMIADGMFDDPGAPAIAGIRATGAEVISYGSPIFPGAMFLLAYLGDIPILGLPDNALIPRTSVFDLLVPRLLAGERITRPNIISMGHGGFCAECDTCRYPLCSFGKHD
ncbi:molybdopterin-binding protein [uncultured Pseudodesulfovibrio sp.]|uniref:molybdopterin-binding protein n=1 Tax=uncultured Pseudodesulfovibrio sp. TaxID=2035858 RepID=UPI0029C77582|nr:molybdopterin-binding protein [uncultured Pseudodesulfovibrio sp.]